MDRKTNLPPTLPQMWWKCIHDFLSERAKSLETHRAYEQFLREFFASGKHPDSYTRADVLQYCNRPASKPRGQNKPPSASLFNNRLNAVKCLYEYASAWTVSTANGPTPLFARANPAAGIEFRPIVSTARGLSSEELKRFFAAIDKGTKQKPNLLGLRDFSLFWGFFMTARRLSEWLSLTWGAIEACTFAENGLARNGYRFSYVGKARHGQEEWAELPLSCYHAIVDWLAASGRIATIEKSDYVFTSFVIGVGRNHYPTGKRLPNTSARHRMKIYLQRANLPPTHSIHSLRHSSAVAHYLASNRDLIGTQRLLGHKNVAVTQKYLGLLIGESDPVASAIEAAYGVL